MASRFYARLNVGSFAAYSGVRTQNDAGYGRGFENIGRRYTFGVRAKF